MNHWFRLLLLFPLCGSFVYRAWAHPDEQFRNLTLYDHIEPISTAEAGGLHNSCWGYTADDGREYAFLGTQVGTYVVDITTKPIREVAFIAGPRSVWRNIKVYKTFAYICTENRAEDQNPGLQIVDLSALPDTATLIRTDTSTLLSAHTLWIADHYLYAMGTKAEAQANGGAVILDLEPDPTRPRRVGSVDPYYYHDAFVRNDTLVGAAINGEGCDIYNIADKQNPRHIATITYPFSGTHNTALTQDGKFVLTSDEVGFTPKTLKVWDIHDPDDIVMVAQYSPNLVETIHNVRVKGRYAFVAWYTAGVRVIDMIDPLHPREVGFYDTYLGSDGGFNGVWEVYPYYPSGKIVASDRNSGLYVFEFNGAVGGSISGVVKNRVTGDPIPNAALVIPELDDTVQSDPAGRYYIGTTSGRTISIHASKFGFEGTEISEQSVDGDGELEILMDPIPFHDVVVRLRDRTTGEAISKFSYTVDPYIEPATSKGDSVTLSLPEDVPLNLTVGRWGYAIERLPIVATATTSEVVVDCSPAYQDDATLDLGWSYAAPEDNATTGRWNRIRPYLGYPHSDWVHPPSEPAGTRGRIFFTGKPPLFAPPESNDVSNGRTTLTSPTMDLGTYSDPMIVFDLWFVQFERDTVRDTLVVELSNDDGASWRSAYREVKGTSGWKRHVLFVRDYLTPTSEMQARFRLSDTLGNILIVAGMDNFDVIDRLFSDQRDVATSPAVNDRFFIHPNPTSGQTDATVQSKGEQTTLDIVDLLGKNIATPFRGYLPPGLHHIDIDSDLAQGIYFVRLITESEVTVRKLVIR